MCEGVRQEANHRFVPQDADRVIARRKRGKEDVHSAGIALRREKKIDRWSRKEELCCWWQRGENPTAAETDWEGPFLVLRPPRSPENLLRGKKKSPERKGKKTGIAEQRLNSCRSVPGRASSGVTSPSRKGEEEKEPYIEPVVLSSP